MLDMETPVANAERLFHYYVRRAEYDRHNNNSMELLDAIMRVAKGETTVYDARLLAAAVGVDYCLVRDLFEEA